MRKLWLIGLAASAAITPMAAAQTVPDGDPAQAVAAARLNAPTIAAAAHDQAAAAGPAMRRMVREVRRPGVEAHRWAGGPQPVAGMRGPHPGPGFRFHKIRRGGVVPGFWMGPNVVVRNWGAYGFPAPVTGHRWIRYYDDALLVDRYGRVRDGRYGYDWRRHDRDWDDRDGVPVYVGEGDYEPEEWDYEWAERWERGEGDDYADGHGGPPPRHGPMPPHGPMPMPGYGYGGGYGCGCGPVVITETVTTTAPVVETRTYYEYVTERAAPKRQYRRPARRAPARRAPPPPRPGERG
jgi:Ni/Co efflux regulator RcnB